MSKGTNKEKAAYFEVTSLSLYIFQLPKIFVNFLKNLSFQTYALTQRKKWTKMMMMIPHKVQGQVQALHLEVNTGKSAQLCDKLELLYFPQFYMLIK